MADSASVPIISNLPPACALPRSSTTAPTQLISIEILKDCAYFHVSGITAAISQQAAQATFEALDIADELGVTVCFDINYRKNLWKYEGADPRGVLSHMLSRCDMMFGDAVEFDWLWMNIEPGLMSCMPPIPA